VAVDQPRRIVMPETSMISTSLGQSLPARVATVSIR